MNKKLHILFLSSWFPSRVQPINGDFILRHAKTVATKHKVTAIHVITDANLKSSIEVSISEQNNIKIIIAYIRKTNNSITKFYSFFRAYKKCLNLVDFFDIVHLNVTYPKGIVALYLKWFKKKSYIISEHWTGYQFPMNKSIGIIRKNITQLIVKNASFVCPVSNFQKNDMVAFGLKGNYQPIPNVIDTNLFYPIKKSSKKYVITHISSFTDQQKNISGLLKVIKQLSLKRSDFIFKIVGNDNIDIGKNIIDKLKIPSDLILLEGAKSHEEIAKILQESNLYISFSNYESFGIVMTEAIATGTPVISTNTGILTELDVLSFTTIIPINDQDILLETINQYIDSKKVYDTKMMHSFIQKRYGVEVISNAFSKLYYKSLNIL